MAAVAEAAVAAVEAALAEAVTGAVAVIGRNGGAVAVTVVVMAMVVVPA